MGALRLEITGDRVTVKLSGYLTSSDFEVAMTALARVPRGSQLAIDLLDTSYIDAFEGVVLSALMDRAESCAFRCAGHVREAAQLTWGSNPKVFFEEG